MIRELLDTSPIGLAVVSMETKERIFVNQSFIEMFGAKIAEDLLSRPIAESWVDQQRFLEVDKILSAEKNLVDFQAERYRLDGSKWWVLMNSHFTEFDGQRARVLWHVDITEMVEARAAVETAKIELESRVDRRTAQLQKTEKRFRDYAEIASDWFWEMDSDLRYTFISGTYERISGKSPQSLIDRTRREMYQGQYPEERNQWMQFLDTLDAHEDFDNFTYTYRRDDGELRFFSNSGRAFFDDQGAFQGYRGVGIDKTEQHRLQTQLQENQAQLLAFSENSTSSATIVDTNCKYLMVNDAVCEMFGRKREQIIGKTPADIYRADDAQVIQSHFQSVIDTGKAHQYEFPMIQEDGKTRNFLIERFPILSTQGDVTGVGSVSTDITERKKIEEDLRKSESRFQMIVDMQTEMVTRFSPDWKLTFVNRAYCEFVNETDVNLIGSDMFSDVPGEETSRLISYFESFTPENSVQKNENQLQRYDGELRDFEWSNFAQFDSEGRVTSYQSVARDVTDQRKTQREIVLATEKAQDANRAKSNFLSTMSHEIRTPLNGVLGLAQLLTDSNLDPDQRKKVDTILSSGQTLLSIINDVLDMSKIEAGGLELEETAFSLRDLISVVATPFQSLADEKGIKLRVSDSVSAGLFLKGDPVRLRQIIWNLLSNAIKFTDQGNVHLTIHEMTTTAQSLETNKDHVIIFSVEDTGDGISPDRLNIIFDPFTQADSSITRKFGGTGLGLSIVKQLSEMMGGTIQAESTEGLGSNFIVALPFHLASPEETEKLSLSLSPQNIDVASPMQILVAEDNPVNAMIAKSFLEKFGHRVRVAENGKIAVDEASKSWADLILMDIHMPEMDGIEATRTIRGAEWGATLPIIGLTAEAFAERHAHFREAGMNDVLTKPFTERQLAEMLHKFRKTNAAGAEPAVDGTTHVPSSGKALSNSVELPIGDDLRFEELRRQMPAEVMATLLRQAKQSLESQLEELRDGVKKADSEKIREAAHAIKGSSGSMFASRISALAGLVEDNFRDMDALHQYIPQLEDTTTETLDWWSSKQNGTEE